MKATKEGGNTKMKQYEGTLITHTGSMFSGKTTALLETLKRFEIAGYKTRLFRPMIDTRYNTDYVTNHTQSLQMGAVYINTFTDIFDLINDIDIIGIDEVQFLGISHLSELNTQEYLIQLIYSLLGAGKTVVVAGLDLNYKGIPFENMKTLISISQYVYKHKAVCLDCGRDAWVSHRTVKEEAEILVGGNDKYIPLCFNCYTRRIREGK